MRRVPALAVLSLLLACGCSTQTRLRETELEELMQRLPGAYENGSQAAADVRDGVRPAHEPLALLIIGLDAPRLGHRVFYVQEAASDDPRRVMEQRIWTFEVDDQGIEQHVFEFVEPRRWRNGQLDPDLFRALLPEDVRLGCTLTWTKESGRFHAAAEPKHCGRDERIELGPDELVRNGYRFRRSST